MTRVIEGVNNMNVLSSLVAEQLINLFLWKLYCLYRCLESQDHKYVEMVGLYMLGVHSYKTIMLVLNCFF